MSSVTVSQLVGKVSIDGADKAQQDLKNVGKASADTGEGFKGFLKNALSMAAGFGIFNLAGDAFSFLKTQIGSVFSESMNAAAGMAQTNAVLASTHDASGETSQAIADLAGQMSHLTLFSDDTTQSAENMLLTFTNIGKSVFPLATKTVLDMSQALGQDTKSSAIQLGKALNDPITGITALQRVGVTFTDSQKNLIKSLVDSGNVAGAQKVILQELQREFGGSAVAAGKTFPGQLQILGQSFDDIKQNIGDALMPVLQQLTGYVTSTIVPAVGTFGTVLSSPAFESFAAGVGKDIEDTLKNVGSFAQADVVPAINAVVRVIQSPQFANFAASLGNLGNTVKSVVTGAFKDLKAPVSDLFTFVQTTALPALTGLINGVSGATNALNNNKPVVAAVAGVLTAIFIPAMIKSGVESVTASGKIAVQYVGGIIKTGVEGWTAAGKLAAWTGGMIASGVQAVIAGTKVAASFVANIVKSGAEAVVAGAKIAAQFVASVVKAGVQAVITGGQFVASLIPAITSMAAEAIAAAATAIPPLIAGLIAWTAGAWAAAAGMIAATWPILLIIAGIALLVAGIILLVTHWKQVTDFLSGVWSTVVGFVQTQITVMGVAFTGLKTIVANVWNGIWAVVKGGINNIIGGINSFIGFIDSIQIHIPSIGVGPLKTPAFNWDGLGIPKIPMLEAGGIIAQAGTVMLGEAGPELVKLPAGAQVFPNTQSQSIAGGSQEIHVHFDLDGREMAHVLVDPVGQKIVKKLLSQGPVKAVT